MNYEQLKKLYYKDREGYESTYKERFDEGIKPGIEINGYPAFYVRDVEIYKKIINIQRINDRILSVCSALPGAALDQYARNCLIDEIVVTNEIEGVHSTRKEIAEVLADLGRSDKRHRFQGLVNKYMMLNHRESIELNDSGDIRALYDELVASEVEEQDPANLPDGKIFRKNPVQVISSRQETAHTGIMPETSIIAAMDKALDYLNSDKEEIIVRTAVFHYLFGYIHPFYDGNGRLNRFISSYMLTKVLHPITGYTLSYIIKDDIRKYYRAFSDCNDKLNRGDVTPFINIFIDIVEKDCLQLEETLVQREAELRTLRSMLKGYPEDEKMQSLYDVLLQATLFSPAGISTVDLLEYFNISRPTLNRRLEKIRGRDLLDEKYIEKEKYYRLKTEKL